MGRGLSRQTPTRNRLVAGFSMIELLISIAILLVGIVAVAQLVPVAIQSNYRNRYDSTALIIAQRQLEQMAAQELTVGDPTAPNGPYFFFNSFLPATTLPSTLCNLGQAPPIFSDAPANPPPAAATNGAPLVAGALAINWSLPQGAVPAGYWNQVASAEGYTYETRWNVATYYGNINGWIRPVGKRIVISTRGGPVGTAFPPTTLVALVGWR